MDILVGIYVDYTGFYYLCHWCLWIPMVVLNSLSYLTVQIWYCILHLMLTSCLRHSAGTNEGKHFVFSYTYMWLLYQYGSICRVTLPSSSIHWYEYNVWQDFRFLPIKAISSLHTSLSIPPSLSVSLSVCLSLNVGLSIWATVRRLVA